MHRIAIARVVRVRLRRPPCRRGPAGPALADAAARTSQSRRPGSLLSIELAGFDRGAARLTGGPDAGSPFGNTRRLTSCGLELGENTFVHALCPISCELIA